MLFNRDVTKRVHQCRFCLSGRKRIAAIGSTANTGNEGRIFRQIVIKMYFHNVNDLVGAYNLQGISRIQRRQVSNYPNPSQLSFHV